MHTISEIRQMDISQINTEIEKGKRDLLKLKLQVASSQSREIHQLKALRKYIAKLQTIKNQLSKSIK